VAIEELGRMGLSSKILANRNSLVCAERIAALTLGFERPLKSVFFANSGAEANECAIRLASYATGRRSFVALHGAYHGKTLGCAALTDSAHRACVAETAMDVCRIARDDIDGAERALANGDVAAVFIELLQGEGGIRPLRPSFVAALKSLCQRYGTMLVVDEVQTGLGRTGPPLMCQTYNVSPDIITLGKILGGGLLPISATVFDTDVVGSAAADPVVHSSSFAGGGLACAVAARVVEIVVTEEFQGRIAYLSYLTMQRLSAMKKHCASIVDVRGSGLMIGVEFASPELCGEAMLEAAKLRLLVTFCLNQPTVMRIYPPATLSEGVLEDGLHALEKAIMAAEISCAEPS
jgi:acetylornithine aminotransferase/putrescine aminotransferase